MSKIVLRSMVPERVGYFIVPTKEYMQYLYYPFLFPNKSEIVVENRLQVFTPMIELALGHYFANYKELRLGNPDMYGYITIKQTFVPVDIHQNRPGWHSDGFGSDDVQYIWFDKFPTEFMIGEFEVSDDDLLSMLEMQAYGDRIEWEKSGDLEGTTGGLYQPLTHHLYHINQNHIHRTTPATESGSRCFVKITFSKHQYAQEGNSKNYHFDYSWDEAPRKAFRNQPHQK